MVMAVKTALDGSLLSQQRRTFGLISLITTLPEHEANGEYQRIKSANSIISGRLSSQGGYTSSVGKIDLFMNKNFGRIVWVLHEYFLDSLYSWDALDFVGSSSGKP